MRAGDSLTEGTHYPKSDDPRRRVFPPRGANVVWRSEWLGAASDSSHENDQCLPGRHITDCQTRKFP
jgi:hypothetical protein